MAAMFGRFAPAVALSATKATLITAAKNQAPVVLRLVSARLASSAAQKKELVLELQDGNKLVGTSFGAEKSVTGEVVFSTAMVGYPESMTDPSYKGQILVLTQPLIGNYGVPSMKEVDEYGIPIHFESSKIQVAGLVVSNYSEAYSHWTAVKSLSEWCKEEGVPAITGVDTRELTKICRGDGTMPGKLQFAEQPSLALENPFVRNLVAEVSRNTIDVYNRGAGVKVLAVDCGIKNNIIRQLCRNGAEVTVVPWNYDFVGAKARGEIDYDALFLSNGPGDPTKVLPLVEQVKKLYAQDRPIPIFGICMGNQVMALAAGMSTYKMKFGNRGHNQPVINPLTQHCMITSQNHGFAVDHTNLPAGWHTHYMNVNDGTNEGVFHESKPFASVQFHPEAMGGPLDADFLFAQFLQDVRDHKAKMVFDWMKESKPYLYKKRNAGAAKPVSVVKRSDVQKVLVLGSGGLQIGQAGEFDYSGSQAIKALKEEGVDTVLINPNIATIQTGEDLADTVYFLPLTPQYIEHIMQKEKPDGVLLTFGGQTALNVGVRLHLAGKFVKHGVKVLGTPVETLITSEDRDLFAVALGEINEPVARSAAVASVSEALKVAEQVGYPVIIRSAYALGGLGSGFADNAQELEELASTSLSLVPQILVERSMKGWKELEYEVVRDANDNCITVCNMENFDPLGIHTGDSIVVAPSQTITDKEYHMLRTAAINIVRKMGVVGECNVQYALNPETSEYCVIEMNARLSRSSALASKATGYPLAFVAAKLALGYTLPEVKNSVTQKTTACFEPSLDYIVTKVPRWDLSKFGHVSNQIGSCMKSVGEVMAIGRTFEESFQKALRMVDPANQGFVTGKYGGDMDTILEKATDRRVFALADAMYNKGYGVDKLHDMTKIDKWFLNKLKNIVETDHAVKQHTLETLPAPLLKQAKQMGFSDARIGDLLETSEMHVRHVRKAAGIIPNVKQIDTLAGEFPAQTNYLYTTYNATHDDVTFGDRGVMVLGSGVYRIGSSVEFDWCGVSTIRALRRMGKKTIMVNYNPETVSTDYDECDRLYFEELTAERVLDIYEREHADGVITSMGGQQPQNITNKLYDEGANILGTHPHMVDMAENRYKFSQLLDRLQVDQPQWAELTSIREAEGFCLDVGYPVLIRPSYVLSGAAMNVAYNKQELDMYLEMATDVSPEHPVVITKFIDSAKEIDIDAVAANGQVLVHAVSEHVENAGVHSGDATLVLPPMSVAKDTLVRLKEITSKVAAGLQISGPFNMQILHCPDDSLKVIECNLRASRSFPFVSKTLGRNFVDLATEAIVAKPTSSYSNEMLPAVPLKEDLMATDRGYYGVKVPQFSFTRLAGADPKLGVEMASTGEVACFGATPHEAYLKGLQSVHGFKLPKKSLLLMKDDRTSPAEFAHVAQSLSSQGFTLFGGSDVAAACKSTGVSINTLDLTSEKGWAEVKAKLASAEIEMCVDMTSGKANSAADPAYRLRRMAVDHGVALVNNNKCAVLFVDALKAHKPESVADAVLPWDHYVHYKAGGTTPADRQSAVGK